MITLRLYVENIAGDWFGWIEDFPGAYASGLTSQDVERSAPRAFADHLHWFKVHGEPVPPDLLGKISADFDPQIDQMISGTAGSVAEVRHCMAADRRPLRAHEFQQVMRLLRITRSDLVDAAGAIPPHQWDTAPLGGQSIRAHMQRLADCESSMLGRIGVEAAVHDHPNPLTVLARVRAMFEAAVTAEFEKGHTKTESCDSSNWPLPKVLRMSVWHERHTARQIQTRSNPVAYLRSIKHIDAVVRTRDVTDRTSDPDGIFDEESPTAKYPQVSGYYY